MLHAYELGNKSRLRVSRTVFTGHHEHDEGWSVNRPGLVITAISCFYNLRGNLREKIVGIDARRVWGEA
jgi:hypothetical protein